MSLHDEDLESLFNIRDWIQEAIEAKGGRMVGGGIGMGQADLDIKIEGYDYFVSIKPILK